MWGREEEIGVGRQLGWHGDSTVQVILGRCRAPALLWLPACTRGKQKCSMQLAAGNWNSPGSSQCLYLPSHLPNPALRLWETHPRLFGPVPVGGLALASAGSKPSACCEV